MEEDKKYYQPTLEDIHIGYQCQIGMHMDNKTNWRDITIRSRDVGDYVGDYNNIVYALENPDKTYRVRTKYLDKEDIESLGWTHTGGQMVSWGRQDYEIGRTSEENGLHFCLYHHQKAGTVEINVVTHSDMGGNEVSIYNGKCSSINELKKLMSWLSIN